LRGTRLGCLTDHLAALDIVAPTHPERKEPRLCSRLLPIAEWGWKNAVRPSRPRFARRLRMRHFLNAINKLPSC
jgi:hypothetical protein